MTLPVFTGERGLQSFAMSRAKMILAFVVNGCWANIFVPAPGKDVMANAAASAAKDSRALQVTRLKAASILLAAVSDSVMTHLTHCLSDPKAMWMILEGRYGIQSGVRSNHGAQLATLSGGKYTEFAAKRASDMRRATGGIGKKADAAVRAHLSVPTPPTTTPTAPPVNAKHAAPPSATDALHAASTAAATKALNASMAENAAKTIHAGKATHAANALRATGTVRTTRAAHATRAAHVASMAAAAKAAHAASKTEAAQSAHAATMAAAASPQKENEGPAVLLDSGASVHICGDKDCSGPSPKRLRRWS